MEADSEQPFLVAGIDARTDVESRRRLQDPREHHSHPSGLFEDEQAPVRGEAESGRLDQPRGDDALGESGDRVGRGPRGYRPTGHRDCEQKERANRANRTFRWTRRPTVARTEPGRSCHG